VDLGALPRPPLGEKTIARPEKENSRGLARTRLANPQLFRRQGPPEVGGRGRAQLAEAPPKGPRAGAGRGGKALRVWLKRCFPPPRPEGMRHAVGPPIQSPSVTLPLRCPVHQAPLQAWWWCASQPGPVWLVTSEALGIVQQFWTISRWHWDLEYAVYIYPFPSRSMCLGGTCLETFPNI